MCNELLYSSARYFLTQWRGVLFLGGFLFLYLFVFSIAFVPLIDYLASWSYHPVQDYDAGIDKIFAQFTPHHWLTSVSGVLRVLIVNLGSVPVIYILCRNIILNEDISFQSLKSPFQLNYLRIYLVLLVINFVFGIFSVVVDYILTLLVNIAPFLLDLLDQDPFGLLLLSLPYYLIVTAITTLLFLAPGLAAIGKRNALYISISWIYGHFFILWLFISIVLILHLLSSYGYEIAVTSYMQPLFITDAAVYPYAFNLMYDALGLFATVISSLIAYVFISFFLRQILVARQNKQF